MDQEREHEHLAQADRHIAEATARIAVLKERIALDQQWGYSTATSTRTVNLFEETLRLMMAHRETTLRELGETVPFPC